MRARQAFVVGILGVLLTLDGATLPAQPPAPQEGMIRLNFPEEIELQALVDFVSQRLNVRILYDRQSLAGKKITLRLPGEIPVNSLREVLQSALKMQGLLLVDAEAPGWQRIEKDANLARVAPTGRAVDLAARFGQATPVTQVFRLKHADPQQVAQAIKPFLNTTTTAPGQQGQSNTIEVKESGILIVTDFAVNLIKVAQVIELLDQARPGVRTEFIPVEHMASTELETQLKGLVQAKNKAQGLAPGAASGLEISNDRRTNQLILIGQPDRVTEALALAKSLDVGLGTTTEVYRFQYVSPQRMDALVRGLLGSLQVDRLYHSSQDEAGNALIVSTTPDIHRELLALREKYDVQATQSASPVRFYKIKNVDAMEVLDSLRALESGGPRQTGGAGPGRSIRGVNSGNLGRQSVPPAGPNNPPAAPAPTRDAPFPPNFTTTDGQAAPPLLGSAVPGPDVGVVGLNGTRITADPSTNSLIVVARPDEQRIYEELIRSLDRRRPQVLVDVKVVVVDTSDSLDLGVEFSAGDRTGGRKLFSFSQFGFSQVDPTNGMLTLAPGLGFNGALLDPSTADVIVRALATHRRSRVVSAPRVLVNDHATGLLTSVAEVPFTSLNASQTVATTSFAGFAEAGTTIEVTPHISEADHLQLEFNVTLNSFTGAGSPGVPPPRQTDEVTSQVTIPDGYTVIVGGLNRKFGTDNVDAIPFTENIPLLKYALSSRSRSTQCTSLFVFIRPIILRDDKFKDLKFLSARDLKGACTTGHYPASGPMLMK